MKPIVSVYIATSLDGFIARENQELDWLDAAGQNVPEGEDFGYAAFMSNVDLLVMGRHTYEKVLTFGDWPYQEKRVVVLSSRPLEIPPHLSHLVTHSSESPHELCQRLGQEGMGRIYLDGGVTIQRFLAAGLVDDMVITLIPVLLGSGKPLFGSLTADIPLKLIAAKPFDCGFVQLTYAIEP